MASTITYINESLVDKKVVEALRYFMPMLNSFSYKPETKGKIQDDVVYVPIATDPSVASKTAGTMLTAGGTLTGTSVTLSNFYGAAWDATEGKMSGEVFANWWAEAAAGAMYATCKQVVDAALAVVTKANYGTDDEDQLICAPADFGQLDLALLWQKAATKIKQRQISLGLNASYAAQLLGESNLALIFSNSGNNFVGSGVVPNLLGMNTWCYAGFPTNSESLGGAVFGKAAILVAVAPPDPIMAGGDGNIMERRIITDTETGISALYTMRGDAGGTVTGEVALLYGVAKGQDAVVRLASA